MSPLTSLNRVFAATTPSKPLAGTAEALMRNSLTRLRNLGVCHTSVNGFKKIALTHRARDTAGELLRVDMHRPVTACCPEVDDEQQISQRHHHWNHRRPFQT